MSNTNQQQHGPAPPQQQQFLAIPSQQLLPNQQEVQTNQQNQIRQQLHNNHQLFASKDRTAHISTSMRVDVSSSLLHQNSAQSQPLLFSFSSPSIDSNATGQVQADGSSENIDLQ